MSSGRISRGESRIFVTPAVFAFGMIWLTSSKAIEFDWRRLGASMSFEHLGEQIYRAGIVCRSSFLRMRSISGACLGPVSKRNRQVAVGLGFRGPQVENPFKGLDGLVGLLELQQTIGERAAARDRPTPARRCC